MFSLDFWCIRVRGISCNNSYRAWDLRFLSNLYVLLVYVVLLQTVFIHDIPLRNVISLSQVRQ